MNRLLEGGQLFTSKQQYHAKEYAGDMGELSDPSV
jgi:hypothetical protein